MPDKIISKQCSKCELAKSVSAFGKKNSNKDGLRFICKSCISVSDAAKYKANPAKAKATYTAYRVANPDKLRASKRAYRMANPEICRIHQHNRRAREIEAGGVLSKGLSSRLFKLQKGKCPCCGKALGKNFHLDHKMPLKLGGTNTDDNIQLLRAICNMQKHTAHPIDFMQSKGFLL